MESLRLSPGRTQVGDAASRRLHRDSCYLDRSERGLLGATVAPLAFLPLTVLHRCNSFL